MTAQSIPPQPRWLTVSRLHYAVSRDRHRRQMKVPYLRLRGHWLSRAGFVEGAKVKVVVAFGCITILAENTT